MVPKRAKILPKRFGWLLLALSGLLLWLQAGAALAAPEDEAQNPLVVIKARGNVGNFAKPGTWLTLEVEVTNQGSDLKGQLKVASTDDRPEYSIDYASNAVVPQGTTKQFSFYLPVNDYLNTLQLELVTEKGVAAKTKVDFTAINPNQLAIGLLDRGEEGFSSFTGLKAPNGLYPTLLTLKSESLPEKAELLSMFDIIVVDDVYLKLKSEQAAALAHWVSRGGTLVVGGGSGWQKIWPNLPPEFQVISVTGVETKNLSSLPKILSSPVNEPLTGPVRVATLRSTQATPVLDEQGTPLALNYKFGDGKVLFLAFDPALEPIASWPGTKVLWQDLLPAATTTSVSGKLPAKGPVGPIGTGLRVNPGNLWGLANALRNIPAMGIPSLRSMFVVLVIYILLAGLINYFVLKKLDRREWAWFTVPGLAILCTALIYLTSFQSRPNQVISHQISIVDVKAQSSLAQALTATGFFAPNRNTYNISFAGRHLVNALPSADEQVVSQAGLARGQKRETTLTVEQDPGQTWIQLRKMRAWVMRGFTTTDDIHLQGTLNGEIASKDGKWLATLTNNTGYDFSDGVIVSPTNWFAKVGALRNGDKLETEIPMNSGTINAGPPLFDQIYNPAVNWKGPGAPPRQEQKDQLRQQVLESLFGGDRQWGDEVVFLGWSDQPVDGALSLPDNALTKYYTSLFVVPLSLKFNQDNLEIPAGLLNAALISTQNVDMGPPGMVIMRPNGEAVYQATIPPGKFSELQLSLRQRGKSPDVVLKGYLYNWNKAAWEEAEFTGDQAVVKGHPEYLNQNREVRIKVTNQQGYQELFGVDVAVSSKGGGQ